GIVVNKNAIPYDELPPATASGVRIGTPALTSRGLESDEIRRVGELIARVLDAPDDDDIAAGAHAEVLELCDAFPAPGVPLA
ncbi:MAG: serine hydroxymethyltransferase, partial [Chloroflexi bacterium]|nr:serine hydroxymethyltransferase [Chloroflexota bacterium]MYE32010.1 serine hydroxymethyltransferase [Chloroflexota bacterium]